LLAGCPVLLSDQTPWRNLGPCGIGWEVPLSPLDRMRDVLREVIGIDGETHRAMSHRAREAALEFISRDDSAHRNAVMFRSALSI
jgi:hypothetical protein